MKVKKGKREAERRELERRKGERCLNQANQTVHTQEDIAPKWGS